MSVRSFTKIWLHLIWGTHNHEKKYWKESFVSKYQNIFLTIL